MRSNHSVIGGRKRPPDRSRLLDARVRTHLSPDSTIFVSMPQPKNENRLARRELLQQFAAARMFP